MSPFFNRLIDRLLAESGLEGLMVLLATIPLAVIQGIVTLFPFPTLIFIHIGALDLWGGLVSSWLAGTIAAVAAFWIFRYLFAERLRRKWLKKLEKYAKWQHFFDVYGIWVIILLRTLPIMPNNLVSFMAAVSPIKMRDYVWSSVIGSLSHIWLFGVISSAILLPPDTDQRWLIGSYVLFCTLLLIAFWIVRGNKIRKFPGLHAKKPSNHNAPELLRTSVDQQNESV
jgi:uncharacterized membrane protein YdjX (TVP38/TMEM64 family)